MDTESCDQLKVFCEAYISQNGRNRPTSEWQLASAFVKSFRIPPILDVPSLEGFFVEANIELRKANLPSGLLAVNMSFEGKRRIDLSGRREQIHFQVHTVLHEIREFIENEFCRLGFSTTDSRDLEQCANEFAFFAIISSLEGPFKYWLESTWETEREWRRWGAVGLICIAAVACFLYSFVGAFFPHVTVTRSGVRFER
jgi:hypothetical protein